MVRQRAALPMIPDPNLSDDIQGSILRNFIAADSFSDKFSS
jgi:hypothetical protein